MSLVREALAKAEREAAARAAREKGVTGPLADTAQPYRARRRRPHWPWIAALVVAAAGGALVAIVTLRAPATAPARQPPAAPVSNELPATVEAAAPAIPPVAAEPSPAPIAEASPAAELAATVEVTEPPRAQTPVAARHDDAARPTTEAPPGANARVAPSVDATPLLAGTFVREFPLGDGRSIKLGGIAWSQAAPLAYLNGKLRGVGETVEGLRVAAIEPERVLLEDGRLRYALTLR